MRYLLTMALACLGTALMFSLHATPSGAITTHYGNNAYTQYRLPWQHGTSHGLSQGYNQGNHTGDFQQYSLDFAMPTGTSVLAITEGWACLNTGSGLGNFVVQLAPPPLGSGRSGSDFYFLAHNESSWITSCSDGWTYLYEGQIAAWSDNTGTSTGPHLHMTVQNPGAICYCSTSTLTAISVPFPSLSGLDFGAFAGNDPPVDYFVSDSVMPGDDNTVPAPGHFAVIASAWLNLGGFGVVGVPFDNGGGPGAHLWGPGVVQDYTDPYGGGIIMQYYGAQAAYWVHGAIRQAYFTMFGGYALLGYPVSNEYAWNTYRRSDFQNNSICWGAAYGAFPCGDLLDRDGDGCSNVDETLLRQPTNPYNPWDFYSVPVPALFAAPSPTTDFKDHVVGAADAQSVFGYYKKGAKTGTTVYEQDLNRNGIADGIEYDRSFVGPAMSGPPQGQVSAQAAQIAFAQYKQGYRC